MVTYDRKTKPVKGGGFGSSRQSGICKGQVNSLRHLASSAITKRHGKNGLGRKTPLHDQELDSFDKRAGLACPRAGNDEQGTVAIFDRA